jgi:acetyl-CoA carboxylase biotin carboxyl carrier protein
LPTVADKHTKSEKLANVDFDGIRRVVELMNEHELTHFHLKTENFNLKLKKGPDLDALKGLLGSVAAPLAAAPAAPGTAAAADGAEPAPDADGFEVTSPMVGTFYSRPAPDAAPFVKVGDPVAEGKPLCIIEAMKVMNEIKAECSGTVTAVLIEDGTPVQFGDPLFRMK